MSMAMVMSECVCVNVQARGSGEASPPQENLLNFVLQDHFSPTSGSEAA